MVYKIDKEQLLKESQELGFDEVEMGSIFESLELDEDTQVQLKEAFELASRNGAATLLEKHLESLVEKAQEQVDTLHEEVKQDYDTKLDEAVDGVLLAVAEEWLGENEKAVENVVLAKLGSSLLEGLKTLLIEHNVSIPEDKIDLYDELVLSEKETRDLANDIFAKNKELMEELNTTKRDQLIDSLSEGLTESQKDTFADLAKAIKLDESFEGRITRLAESFSVKADEQAKKTISLTEGLVEGSKTKTVATEEKTTVLNEEKGKEEKAPRQKSEREQLLNLV